MWDEDRYGGNGGGASCIKVRVRAAFALNTNIVSSSLRSSSNLTFSSLV